MTVHKQRKLVHVKVRLYEEDVAEAKRIAERDERFWHAVLREALHLALTKKKRITESR